MVHSVVNGQYIASADMVLGHVVLPSTAKQKFPSIDDFYEH
jgi:hypothetical protein